VRAATLLDTLGYASLLALAAGAVIVVGAQRASIGRFYEASVTLAPGEMPPVYVIRGGSLTVRAPGGGRLLAVSASDPRLLGDADRPSARQLGSYVTASPELTIPARAAYEGASGTLQFVWQDVGGVTQRTTVPFSIIADAFS